MKTEFPEWDTPVSPQNAIVTEIAHFNARGMRRVYGRGEVFPGGPSFNMDIWLTRDGRLLMRCWSRCNEIDDRSFEINGIPQASIPVRQAGDTFAESWIPLAVRQAYGCWIFEKF